MRANQAPSRAVLCRATVSASNDEGTFPDKIRARGLASSACQVDEPLTDGPSKLPGRDRATRRTGACGLLRGSHLGREERASYAE